MTMFKETKRQLKEKRKQKKHSKSAFKGMKRAEKDELLLKLLEQADLVEKEDE